MTSSTTQGRTQRIRQTMQAHVSHRLSKALQKWSGRTDSQARQETQKAHEKYQLDLLVSKGVAASNGIAIATHIAKGIHPDLKVKKVSNLHVDFAALPQWFEVGSHVLMGSECLADTTGDGAYNAAAYELYLLLECRFEDQSLADLLHQQDADAIAALAGPSTNAATAAQIATECLTLWDAKNNAPATHPRAKQLYWLTGGDATDDTQYHLLAPLYATSLAHAVYGTLQVDRFGEASQAAREARKKGEAHDGVLREYPNLAVQKLGGTKPQNISQLNSERGGQNYLLASLPPQWQSRATRQPWGITSVFDRLLMNREGVRPTLAAFLTFLQDDPPSNVYTRNRVEGYIGDLIDELVALAGELQTGWPEGWTADSRCELVRAEQLWLDPRRAETDEAFRQEWLAMDWPAHIGHRFGNWLNTQLEGHLRVGDAELREWKKELLLDESDDGWAQSLHRLRRDLNAPQYIPTRQGVEA